MAMGLPICPYWSHSTARPRRALIRMDAYLTGASALVLSFCWVLLVRFTIRRVIVAKLIVDLDKMLMQRRAILPVAVQLETSDAGKELGCAGMT
jgi:hypothetical protein